MEKKSHLGEKKSIANRLTLLISELKMSNGAFADSVGIDRSQFSRILQGKLGISRETAIEISYTYNISLDWLLTEYGCMFRNKFENSIVAEPPAPYGKTTCTVPIVDIAAAAGNGYYNPDVLTPEDVIHLPAHLSNRGVHICIRIKGESMSPTLLDGGYLIIRYIDKGNWNTDIKNEHIYVVSDTEGKAVVKRIKNRLEKGFIVLMSDNPDKTAYPNFNIQFEEINTIWHVEWYLSAKMPNIHSGYYKRLQQLEDRLDDFENEFRRKR